MPLPMYEEYSLACQTMQQSQQQIGSSDAMDCQPDDSIASLQNQLAKLSQSKSREQKNASLKSLAKMLADLLPGDDRLVLVEIRAESTADEQLNRDVQSAKVILALVLFTSVLSILVTSLNRSSSAGSKRCTDRTSRQPVRLRTGTTTASSCSARTLASFKPSTTLYGNSPTAAAAATRKNAPPR